MTRIEAIRQALADRPAILRTHWEGCDTEARHADCAIAFLLDEIERRDAALRALVEQLGTIWNDERNCNAARADMALWCRNELSRLLGQEP